MEHQDHISLIKNAVRENETVWADLGSGGGAFTLALRDIVGPAIEIYSVDKDNHRLLQQQHSFNRYFPETHIHYINRDFVKPLDIPRVHGILMANSLHFIPYAQQEAFLSSLQKYLKPDGVIIIVEYNTDSSNAWVPYPRSSDTLEQILRQSGYTSIRELTSISSGFLQEIYSMSAINLQ